MSARAEKRRANAAAAKARKQKLLVLGLGVVLAVLLVIQGPTLLDAFGFGGSSDSTSETRAVPTPVPAPPVRSAPPGRALLFKAGGSDPFSARSLADNDPRAGAVEAPEGARDPFAPRGGGGGSGGAAGAPPARQTEPVAQVLPKQIVIGTPSPNAIARRGWIVVLASIRTSVGRPYAERFAARVRVNGLVPVNVLDSSTNKPLRSGYFVVYTGPFATLDEVQRSAAHVHAFGYRTAYIREILRY